MTTENNRTALRESSSDAVGADKTLQFSAATLAFLRSAHPALAQAFVEACKSDWPYIDVERLPDKTRRYLWRVLKRQDRALVDMLGRPDFVELRKHCRALFQARLELPVNALAAAIHRDDEQYRGRRPAA